MAFILHVILWFCTAVHNRKLQGIIGDVSTMHYTALREDHQECRIGKDLDVLVAYLNQLS
jgi:hypothetical protein